MNILNIFALVLEEFDLTPGPLSFFLNKYDDEIIKRQFKLNWWTSAHYVVQNLFYFYILNYFFILSPEEFFLILKRIFCKMLQKKKY